MAVLSLQQCLFSIFKSAVLDLQLHVISATLYTPHGAIK